MWNYAPKFDPEERWGRDWNRDPWWCYMLLVVLVLLVMAITL